MIVNVDFSKQFYKDIKSLLKKYASFGGDIKDCVDEITINPYQGVDLGQGRRKIRMAISSKNKGKSGGARVITYNVEEAKQTDGEISVNVTLLTVYDKSETENVSDEFIDSIMADL